MNALFVALAALVGYDDDLNPIFDPAVIDRLCNDNGIDKGDVLTACSGLCIN